MRNSLGTLRRRPGRALLTSLGVGLAVGLLVLLLALSAGVDRSASTLAYGSGVDLIATSSSAGGAGSILGGPLPPIPQAHPLATEIPAADPNAVVASPWLISELVFANASLWAAANTSSVPPGWSYTGSGTVGWLPGELRGIETPTISRGTGLTAAGDPHYANGTWTGPSTHEIVLDEALAGVLHVGVGDSVWANPAAPPSNAALPGWFANATRLTVVGLSGAFWLVPSAELAYVYLSELQQLVGGANASTDYASLVLIHLAQTGNPSADARTIAIAFPDLTVTTLADILGALEHIIDVYRTFGALIGAIGLVVAALFTTTVLQMSVDDRSRELALLRAVGYRRAAVGALVVEEGLLLAGVGLGIGLPIAWAGAEAVNRFLLSVVVGLPAGFSFVAFDPAVVAAGVLAVLAVGVVASVAPAARAMLLPVAEELRAP